MYSLSQQFNSWDSVPKIKEYHVEKVYSQQFILQNVFEALFVVAKAKQIKDQTRKKVEALQWGNDRRKNT